MELIIAVLQDFAAGGFIGLILVGSWAIILIATGLGRLQQHADRRAVAKRASEIMARAKDEPDPRG